MRRLLPLLLVAVLVISPQAVTADVPDDAPHPAIDALLERLGGDSFIDRELAGRQLMALGEPAVTPLVSLVRQKQEPAGSSAIAVLRKLALYDRGPAGTAAHRGLAELLASGSPLADEPQLQLTNAVRAADRSLAGLITSLDGNLIRDDSLTVVTVQINDERFTDQQAELLGRFPQLKYLDLRETTISDRSLRAIRTLERLQELNLADTTVTIAGLRQLTPLKSLKKLTIYRLPLTAEEVQTLQSVLPGCEIRH